MNVAYGEERRVIVEIINENRDALLTIKTAISRFERYIDKIKGYSKPTSIEKAVMSSGIPFGSMSYAKIWDFFGQEFTLLDPDLKSCVIAITLQSALMKYEQQGKSIFKTETFNLLSSSDLRIIQPWEQASVCHKCSNFEQIFATHPFHEPKCSKCERDNLTVRIYALDKEFESHKRKNKDLPLFISNLINRKKEGCSGYF